jgi:hypothetical protein
MSAKVAVGDQIKVSFTGEVEKLDGAWMFVRNTVDGMMYKIFEGFTWVDGLPDGVEIVPPEVKIGQIWETASGDKYVVLERYNGTLSFYQVKGKDTYDRMVEKDKFFSGKGKGARVIFGG